MNQLAKKLKSLRTTHELTQQDLADKLFVTKQSVSKWETGKSIPDIKIIKLLATFYGITIDSLMDGSEQSLPESEISEKTKKFIIVMSAFSLILISLFIVIIFQAYNIKALSDEIDSLNDRIESLKNAESTEPENPTKFIVYDTEFDVIGTITTVDNVGRSYYVKTALNLVFYNQSDSKKTYTEDQFVLQEKLSFMASFPFTIESRNAKIIELNYSSTWNGIPDRSWIVTMKYLGHNLILTIPASSIKK